MLITFCSTLGNLNDILDSPTGVPFIAMFFNTTQNAGGATAMSVLIIVMTIAGILTQHATASRQLWAFSRDKGMPFASWFSCKSPRQELR